jgi:hypothetical protein
VLASPAAARARPAYEGQHNQDLTKKADGSESEHEGESATQQEE